MAQQERLFPTTITPWKVRMQQAARNDPSMATDRPQNIVETMAMLRRLGSEQLAIVIIALYFRADAPVDQEAVEQQAIEQSVAHYGAYLSEGLRPLDFILLSQQETSQKTLSYVYRLYFLLAGISNKGAAIIKDQLWEALLRRVRDEEIDEQVHRPEGASAGYSAYPHPCETMQQSLEEALVEQVKVQSVCEQQELAEGNAYQKQLALAQMAQDLGVPYLPNFPQRISTRLKRLIAPALAQELQCYPVGRERNTLTVAMVDPCDEQAVKQLQRITGLRIFPVLADAQEMRVALERII
jgi:hypothetical protein